MKKNMLHLSTINIWNMGKNKGRVSIYLPIQAFTNTWDNVCYMTNNKNEKTRNINGIRVKKINTLIKPIKKKNVNRLSTILLLPLTFISFLVYGIIYSIKHKPLVIYAHTTETALPAYILSKIFDAKYVLRLYGIDEGSKKSIFHKIMRADLHIAFLFKADLYILTNDGTFADQFALKKGVPKGKIQFLKNGINKSWNNQPLDESFKNKLAPSGEKIILTVSRLVKWKQIDIIIKAVHQLLKKRNDLKLVIVGDGVERENLQNLVKNLGISKNVNFEGGQENSKISDYMKVADLFVSMNALSSMSNPVFESMVCKTTVLALNTGNTKELIKDNDTGILIQPDEITTLPEKISDILEDDLRRNKISENAQRFIMQEFQSWEERVNLEIELIENLCVN